MMPLRPDRTVAEKADAAFHFSYQEAVGHMNRADRRTAYGRQKVAEAEAKALQAKIDVLEAALKTKEQP